MNERQERDLEHQLKIIAAGCPSPEILARETLEQYERYDDNGPCMLDDNGFCVNPEHIEYYP